MTSVVHRKDLAHIYALTECATGKVSTIHSSLKATHKPKNFDTVQMAGQVLNLKPSEDQEIFDNMHLAAFNSNAFQVDFKKMLCTLESLFYYQ